MGAVRYPALGHLHDIRDADWDVSSYGTLRQAVRGWRHKATRNYPPDCSYKSCFMLGVKSIRKTSPGISFSEISSKSDTTNRSQITEESITYLFHHHSQKNHINAHASINLTKSIISYLRNPFGILEKINKRGTKHSGLHGRNEMEHGEARM